MYVKMHQIEIRQINKNTKSDINEILVTLANKKTTREPSPVSERL